MLGKFCNLSLYFPTRRLKVSSAKALCDKTHPPLSSVENRMSGYNYSIKSKTLGLSYLQAMNMGDNPLPLATSNFKFSLKLRQD